MALNIGYLTSDKENNELYSPFYIVDHIMKYLPKDKVIWCPFDEEWSAFYVRLKECGYKVIRSSLKDNKNFFEYSPAQWDIIVSNPPFSIKDKVLEILHDNSGTQWDGEIMKLFLDRFDENRLKRLLTQTPVDNFSKSENLIAGTIFDEYKSDNQEENGEKKKLG